MNKKMAGLISSGLVVFATFFATTMCGFLAHRPELPEEMK